jgi:integrase
MKKLVADGVVRQRITPKDLRATCGSWVAASDGVLEAAKRLGHSNTATTTKHYARPIAGRDFKVANNLDQQFNAVVDESRAAS